MDGVLDIFKRGKKPEPPPDPPREKMPEIPADIDLYGLLDVEPSASLEELRAAYREAAKDLHPDLHPGDADALEMFNAVTEAYNILSNAEFRAAYDKARGTAVKAQEKVEKKEQPGKPEQAEKKGPPREPGGQRGSQPWMTALFDPTPEGSMFEMYRSGGMGPVRQERETPWGPRRERPTADYRRVSPQELAASLKETVEADEIMDGVREARKDPGFRGADPIVGIASGHNIEEEAADFLGVPDEVVRDYKNANELERSFWDDVLNPLFAMIPQAMRILTPQDIPGQFFVDRSEDGRGLDLYYSER